MEQQVLKNQLGIFYNSKDSSFKYHNESDLIINDTFMKERWMDTSVAKFYNKDQLMHCIESFPGHTWVTEEMLINEMCNPQNNGYLGDEKAQIMSSEKVLRIDKVNTMSEEYSDLSDYYDDQPVKAMTPFSDVIYTRDYGQAKRTYNNGGSFFFPLDIEQMQKIMKIGRYKFKLEFIKEVLKK